MHFLGSLTAATTLALFVLPTIANDQAIDRFRQVRERREASIAQASAAATLEARSKECNETSCYKYYNSKTKPYLIEQWPSIPWTTGEFYSGSVPIDESDPSRTLFFVFKPATDAPVDEVTIWLNGGPGCSSLTGFWQENGPILKQPGTCKPKRNEFAWSKMTNMLWVEQPVGTGFSKGKVLATSEEDVAKEFVGFYKNWQKIFGTQKDKIYMTGESYAGRYVPYIGAEMLDQQKKGSSLDLQGAMVYDPCIGDCGYVQMEIPAYGFARANNAILNLNESFLEDFQQISAECGYEEYLDKYLQYPPPGNQPPSKTNVKSKCYTQYTFEVAWNDINPCPNIYYIADHCPFPANENGQELSHYLDRKDVKEAIHAPKDVQWLECGEHDVFHRGRDKSVDSIQHALPQVIEATNRVLVSNGAWDALVPTNGTLLSIQNMTWNGALGFQKAPSKDLVVPIADPKQYAGPQGIMGTQHFERGLQWVEVSQSGHMVPEFQPRVAWLQLEWLLGRVESL